MAPKSRNHDDNLRLCAITIRLTQPLRVKYGTSGERLRHTCRHSFHQGQVSPEIRDAIGNAEEHGEVRRVGHHDVAGALGIRREPEQTVELGVASLRERVRSLHIDGLPCEYLYAIVSILRQRV